MTIYQKGYTHSGKFHADDVFSTAVLRLVNPDFTVERVFKVPEDTENCIVYDIGGGMFDHHGVDVKFHENGRRYASFGLIWDKYGVMLSGSQRAFKRIEEKFVSVIDEADNGGEPDMISKVISSFNPAWDSNDDRDKAFSEAVDIAVNILSKTIEHEKAIERADSIVYQALEKMENKIVILDKFVPFSKLLTGTDAVYVIYPSLRGGYCVQGVPVEDESRDVKVPFPDSWRGLEEDDIESISGIKGMTFCHNSGFMASSDTLDTAVEIALKSMDYYKEK